MHPYFEAHELDTRPTEFDRVTNLRRFYYEASDPPVASQPISHMLTTSAIPPQPHPVAHPPVRARSGTPTAVQCSVR